jgi:hypothetical protein
MDEANSMMENEWNRPLALALTKADRPNIMPAMTHTINVASINDFKVHRPLMHDSSMTKTGR